MTDPKAGGEVIDFKRISVLGIEDYEYEVILDGARGRSSLFSEFELQYELPKGKTDLIAESLTDSGIDFTFNTTKPKCECGAEKAYGEGTPFHSSWCPLYQGPPGGRK